MWKGYPRRAELAVQVTVCKMASTEVTTGELVVESQLQRGLEEDLSKVVDPADDDIVYMLAVEFYRTEDKGKTFYQMPTRPTYDVGVHSDHHSLWIDPENSNHFYLAGDAGLHESWDYGKTYNRLNNIPIGQFYGMGVDMEVPYNIYGGMQDNHSWMGPSSTRHWLGILGDDWIQVGFGDGMYQQPHPNSPIVYNASQNGNMIRFDRKTGNMQGLRPFSPDPKERYRFDWVTPLMVSKHSPNRVFLGGNRLFISNCFYYWNH